MIMQIQRVAWIALVALLAAGCGADRSAQHGAEPAKDALRGVAVGPGGAAGSGEPAEPAGAGGDAVDAPAAVRTEAGGLSFVVPAGWTALDPKPMRSAYHDCGDGAEVWFTVLGGDGGGLDANVRRWFSQVGAVEPDDAELAALPKVAMLGGEAVLVDITVATEQGLIGAIRQLPDRAVFVKMIGPADAVRARRDAFVAFCRSFAEVL